MITLPITCTQLGIILACAVFLIGLYLIFNFDYTVSADIPFFTLGMFMAGFTGIMGLCTLGWYSCVFISKHVRCKCE